MEYAQDHGDAPDHFRIAPVLTRSEAALNTILFLPMLLSAAFAGVVLMSVLAVFFPSNRYPAMPYAAIATSFAIAIAGIISALPGRTRGMVVSRLYVCGPDGQQLPRHLARRRIIVGQLLSWLWPVSLVLMIRDPCHRSLADRVCRTLIVQHVPRLRIRREAPLAPRGVP
jgi:hypothetical protein